MATDPKATPEKPTASISADDAKKAAAGEGVTAQDVIAVVSKGEDGKAKVTHYTGDEWKAFVDKVAKGEEKVPEGAQTVNLKDGKVAGEPAALTQKDMVDAHTFSVQREAAKDDLEKIGAEQKPHAAAVVVGKDGNTVSEKVFKTKNEYDAFVKNKGKDLAVGEGQRAVFAEFDKGGKIVAGKYGTHQQPGQAGLEQGIVEGEKESEKARAEGKNKNWLEGMMEKAMESGNIAIMAIAMLAMVMTNRREGHESGEQVAGQPPVKEYDGTPGTAAGGQRPAMEIREVNTDTGGMEKIQVTGMSAEEVADKLGLAGKKDVIIQIAESMKNNGGMVVMDVHGAGGTMPAPTVAAAPSQSTAPARS